MNGIGKEDNGMVIYHVAALRLVASNADGSRNSDVTKFLVAKAARCSAEIS